MVVLEVSLRVSVASRDVDLEEVITKLAGKMFDIVLRYHPAKLQEYLIAVPFSYAFARIQFKSPVRLPVLVAYDPVYTIYYVDLGVHIGKCDLHEIRVWTGLNQISTVDMLINDRTTVSDHYLVAYLAYPEIREAVKEAEHEFKPAEFKRWFYEFLEALDQLPDVDAYAQMSPGDLFDRRGYVREFVVSADYSEISSGDFSADVEKLKIVLSQSRAPNNPDQVTELRCRIAVDIRNKGSVELDFTMPSSPSYVEKLDITVDPLGRRRSKDLVEDATTVLLELLESDRLIGKVRSAIRNFVNAYVKVLIAWKFMDV